MSGKGTGKDINPWPTHVTATSIVGNLPCDKFNLSVSQLQFLWQVFFNYKQIHLLNLMFGWILNEPTSTMAFTWQNDRIGSIGNHTKSFLDVIQEVLFWLTNIISGLFSMVFFRFGQLKLVLSEKEHTKSFILKCTIIFDVLNKSFA